MFLKEIIINLIYIEAYKMKPIINSLLDTDLYKRQVENVKHNNFNLTLK